MHSRFFTMTSPGAFPALFPALYIAVVSLFVAPLADISASAGEVVWKIRSEHPNTVIVEFYSQNRSHVMPVLDTGIQAPAFDRQTGLPDQVRQ
jgi:hypothetical protein